MARGGRVQNRTQAMLVRLVPSLLITGIAAWTVIGPGGLLEYIQREREAEAKKAQWAELERQNDLLLLEVASDQTDPIVVERKIADTMQLVHEGTVLYEFDEDNEIERVY